MTFKMKYTLYVGSANGIIWTAKTKSPNLFVEVKVDGVVMQSTTVIERKKSPVWNQELIISGNSSSIVSLSLKHHIWPFGGDTCIGRINIPIDAFLSRCADKTFAVLELSPDTVGDNGSGTGNITAKLSQLVDVENPVEGTLVGEQGISQAHRTVPSGQLAELRDSILSLQNMVDHTDDRHPDKPILLGKLGINQLALYEGPGEPAYINKSVSNLRKALHLTQDNHPDRSIFLGGLGLAQIELFELFNERADIENAVNNLKEALHLGFSQFKRYECLHELTDIEDSISNLQKAIQLAKNGHPHTPMYLYHLGRSQRSRFERLSRLTDLMDSISNLQKAVESVKDGDPTKLKYLSSLCSSQHRRFERLGEPKDIADCISNLHKVVQLTADGNPDKPGYLSELGSSQLSRYERLGELIDLEESISNQLKAVQLTKDEHRHKPGYLTNLGIGRLRLYERLGDQTVLERSFLDLQKAVQLTSHSHPDKSLYLGNLAISQTRLYECRGKLTDLEDSILNLRMATQLAGDGHASQPVYRTNLGFSQLKRYEQLGELVDLENAISNFQQAAQLTDDGHPDKSLCLANLGVGQQRRFERYGEVVDITHSISNLQCAVRLTDDVRPDKSIFLSNLGLSHLRRYERLGDLADIEDSVSNLHKAVQLVKDGHPNKPIFLSGLSISHMRRYERLGELTDIEDAISNLQTAVWSTEDRHPNKPAYFGNLGICQRVRFERLTELEDVQDSIFNLQMAVELTDDGHPDKPGYLSNLGSSQHFRFECLDNLLDLDDAISNLQKAVHLTENGHPNKLRYLANLGASQRGRFLRLGELPDVENSISNLYKAVLLTDDGHPNKSRYLCNLGLSQLDRFERLDGLSDVEDSISNLQRSVTMVDEDHPYKAMWLLRLGTAQQLLFERLGEPEHLATAISTFKTAAQSKAAYPQNALWAARSWANLSYHHGDISSALDGYRTALEILPKVAWLGLSTPSRQDWLLQGDSENLSRMSATCAIQLGRFEEAVELLDLGRSVFWQQASSLRSDLEELREVDSELVNQLEMIGAQVDAGNFSSQSLLHVEDPEVRSYSIEDVGRERRRLVGEWEGLLERVRKLPRFENFLKPVPFSQLRQAAAGGQVVVVNVSRFGVDALIFGATGQVVHVPLVDADIQTLHKLGRNIVLRQSACASAAQRQSYNTRYLKPALRDIWKDILTPIFDQIQIHSSENSNTPKRRIWWYLTGPLTFFPIHASGPGNCYIDVSRLVISSYVTTLSSLFRAQKKAERGVTGRLKLLAVSQPDTLGHEPLPLAEEEVKKVIHLASSAGWETRDIAHLHGPDGIVDSVSSALDCSSWVHFACHGMQHPTSGMDSAFVLYNGRLELSDIASKSLSAGQFAFLSACHTAAGLKELPGEAMHLAGGLQFAGFPSVIATMWGISDDDAPIVAGHTYEYLFRNGLQGCSPSDAATALNYAVHRLREDPNVTVDRWASFIHFGI